MYLIITLYTLNFHMSHVNNSPTELGVGETAMMVKIVIVLGLCSAADVLNTLLQGAWDPRASFL